MSFNATPKPPSGREGGALEVFRKEYYVWDRPLLPRQKGPGLANKRPRSLSGSLRCRSSDRLTRDRARVCPEGLGPGSRGNPCSTPWTLLADTNRPFGTSDHQARGNPSPMMRYRSTDLVFPREPLWKGRDFPTPEARTFLRPNQVIGEIHAPNSGATRNEVRGTRSKLLSDSTHRTGIRVKPELRTMQAPGSAPDQVIPQPVSGATRPPGVDLSTSDALRLSGSSVSPPRATGKVRQGHPMAAIRLSEPSKRSGTGQPEPDIKDRSDGWQMFNRSLF
jgi:hypothetical protein